MAPLTKAGFGRPSSVERTAVPYEITDFFVFKLPAVNGKEYNVMQIMKQFHNVPIISPGGLNILIAGRKHYTGGLYQ